MRHIIILNNTFSLFYFKIWEMCGSPSSSNLEKHIFLNDRIIQLDKPADHRQLGSPSSSPLVCPSLSESALHNSCVHVCKRTRKCQTCVSLPYIQKVFISIQQWFHKQFMSLIFIDVTMERKAEVSEIQIVYFPGNTDMVWNLVCNFLLLQICE